MTLLPAPVNLQRPPWNTASLPAPVSLQRFNFAHMPRKWAMQLHAGFRLTLLLAVVLIMLLSPRYTRAQGSPSAPIVSTHRPEPAEVKARLNQILSQPDFSPSDHQESELNKSLRKIIDWFHQKWDSVWSRIQNIIDWFKDRLKMGGVSGPFGDVILWTFLAACAGGLLYFLYRLCSYYKAARRNRLASLEDSIQATDEEMEEPTSRGTPDEWVKEASQFASKEDFRRAIRALFLAVLLELDRSSIQEFTRSLTNGDYLSQLRRHGFNTLADSFAPFVLTFEDRWYGERSTTRSDYEQCLTEYRNLFQLIESGVSTRPFERDNPTEDVRKDGQKGVGVAG